MSGKWWQQSTPQKPLVCAKCGRTFTRKRGNLRDMASVRRWLESKLAHHEAKCAPARGEGEKR